MVQDRQRLELDSLPVSALNVTKLPKPLTADQILTNQLHPQVHVPEVEGLECDLHTQRAIEVQATAGVEVYCLCRGDRWHG